MLEIPNATLLFIRTYDIVQLQRGRLLLGCEIHFIVFHMMLLRTLMSIMYK